MYVADKDFQYAFMFKQDDFPLKIVMCKYLLGLDHVTIVSHTNVSSYNILNV